jgi:serine O-acetyltransferase
MSLHGGTARSLRVATHLCTQQFFMSSDDLPLALRVPAQPDAMPRPGLFPNIRADFQAHGRRWGAQGFWALLVYRFGRWRYGVRPVWLRKTFSGIYHLLFKLVQIVAGIELPCEVEIGEGFVIDHSGGIVVSGYCRFGKHCRIRTGVVIGIAHTHEREAPQFGDHVDIGAGAKVIGDIRIGNHVSIGANAVVLCDVPDHHIAVGVPAVARVRKTA